MSLDYLDPTLYNLTSRTKLTKLPDSIAIVLDRKSRVIMKDGERILNQANKIKNKTGGKVTLLTSAPVCSKTRTYLSDNHITITHL